MARSGRNLPIDVQNDGSFVKRSDGVSADRLRQMQVKLLDYGWKPHVVSVKELVWKTKTLDIKYFKKDSDALNVEYISGKPDPMPSTSTQATIDAMATRLYYGRNSKSEFNRAIRRRLLKIIGQTATKYSCNVTYAQGDDGCPWSSRLEPMPNDWSWDKLRTFCKVRLDRLKLMCNRNWICVDTESLCCEIFWQMCTTDSAYQDFLNLPSSVFVNHLLMLSIGHKIHGRQMMTGWPPHPVDISDRQDDLNNVFCENTFSNFTKHLFTKEKCETIKPMLAATAIPAKWCDPGLEAPAFSPFPADIGTKFDMAPVSHTISSSAEGNDSETDPYESGPPTGISMKKLLSELENDLQGDEAAHTRLERQSALGDLLTACRESCGVDDYSVFRDAHAALCTALWTDDGDDGEEEMFIRHSQKPERYKESPTVLTPCKCLGISKWPTYSLCCYRTMKATMSNLTPRMSFSKRSSTAKQRHQQP